jgi:RNA polymerase sigma factor (sigma-70 family)
LFGVEQGLADSQGKPERPAAETLVEQYGRAVFAVCLAHTGNIHDAQDVMQDVFVRALAKLDSLQNPRSARAWLLQIARRMCVDRSRRRAPSRPLPAELAAPAGQSRDEQSERVQAAIRRLSEAQREIIALYYFDRRSCRSVAASLGISEAAVRQRLVRARLTLHELLTEDKP